MRAKEAKQEKKHGQAAGWAHHVYNEQTAKVGAMGCEMDEVERRKMTLKLEKWRDWIIQWELCLGQKNHLEKDYWLFHWIAHHSILNMGEFLRSMHLRDKASK